MDLLKTFEKLPERCIRGQKGYKLKLNSNLKFCIKVGTLRNKAQHPTTFSEHLNKYFKTNW